MNKNDIKKALACCSEISENSCKNCPYSKDGNFSCSSGRLSKDALNLITEQEQEIEYRKKQYDNQVSENTQLYIEHDKLKDDYAKLQELFANYQIASDKEMIAHIKQAKIELLKELIDGYGQDYISHVGLEKYKVWRVLKEIIEELQND